MKAQQALSRYFVEEGVFPAGTSADDWVGDRWYRIGGLPVFPLVGKIKQSLILHDLHHVVTGYHTTWRGELELAGWELGSGGCARHLFFWVDRLVAVLLGLIFQPRLTLRAFRKGWRQRNLYPLQASQALAIEIDELRRYVRREAA